MIDTIVSLTLTEIDMKKSLALSLCQLKKKHVKEYIVPVTFLKKINLVYYS